MKEEDVLKLLEIDIKGLKKILAENLNMKSKDIKIEYDKANNNNLPNRLIFGHCFSLEWS